MDCLWAFRKGKEWPQSWHWLINISFVSTFLFLSDKIIRLIRSWKRFTRLANIYWILPRCRHIAWMFFLEKKAICLFINEQEIESNILGRNETEIWPGIQKGMVSVPKLETQELLNGVIVKNFVFRLVFKMFKMLWVEMSINIKTWSSGGPGLEMDLGIISSYGCWDFYNHWDFSKEGVE